MYEFGSSTSDSVVTGKITSLTAADLEKGSDLADSFRTIAELSIDLLEKLKSSNSKSCFGLQTNDKNDFFSTENLDSVTSATNHLSFKFGEVIELVTELLPKIHDISKEELGDLVDQEMHNTSQAIENAVTKLEVKLNSEMVDF